MLDNGTQVIEADVAHVLEKSGAEIATLLGKRVLITGGAGFLGFLLCHVLASAHETLDGDPIDLVVLDNFVRGRKPWLEALATRDNVTVREFDILVPLDADDHYDYIIHAASIASPTFYRQYPIETIDANVTGLRNLLEHARSQEAAGSPLAGLLFYSTSEIYGDPAPEAIPTPETYRGLVSCTGPRACYDESKRLGETLCVNFAQKHGVPVTMARPFNNYGPGLPITDRRVLPDFARDVLNGNDIVLLSDGRATRTFCYVADAVAGYLKILVRGRPGEPYNIGIEEPEIAMRDLADLVVAVGRELTGYDGKAVYRTSEEAEYLADNPNRRCPDITKARNELGYDPSISLEEGIRRMMIWYRDAVAEERSQ